MNKKNLSTGVLLINVSGTPNSPTTKDVRHYLREFLADKRILDMFWLFRWLLLYCIILPFRSKYSAKLYKKIWTPKGSPLLLLSEACRTKLSQKLGDNYNTVIAMLNGSPSIQHGINTLIKKNVEHLIIVPLFPQYAASTTGSVIEKTSKILNKLWHIPTYSITKPFFQNRYFIQAQAELIIQSIQTQNYKPDFILFSYHGLPLRHLKKSANDHAISAAGQQNKKLCGLDGCCDSFDVHNHFCYRAQCFETTRLIASACNFSSNQFATSFQSRFGNGEWTMPDTHLILTDLYQKGVRTLFVVCPGFVVDCLETLEEIELRLKEKWYKLGGINFVMVSSLNDHDTWISCLAKMIQEDNIK